MVTFQRKYRENVKLLTILKYLADIIVVVCAAYVLVNFMCDRTRIVGNSMSTVLQNDDLVLVNKMKYAFKGPARYDVISFEIAGVTSSRVYVKRVIGLPGESVQITNGKVYINDMELSDDIVKEDILTGGLASEKFILGEDEYFVLGDNRNNSEDSRFSNIGTVRRENIIGTPWVLVTPFNRFKLIF